MILIILIKFNKIAAPPPVLLSIGIFFKHLLYSEKLTTESIILYNVSINLLFELGYVHPSAKSAQEDFGKILSNGLQDAHPIDQVRFCCGVCSPDYVPVFHNAVSGNGDWLIKARLFAVGNFLIAASLRKASPLV